MFYEVVENKKHPGVWHVEAWAMDDDGWGYFAIFEGRDAEARAREYAAFKNAQQASAVAAAASAA